MADNNSRESRFAHITLAELNVLLKASINERQPNQYPVNRARPRPHNNDARPSSADSSSSPPAMIGVAVNNSTLNDTQQQRFPPISSTELKGLTEDSSESINTKRQIKYAVTILSDYAHSIGSSLADVESLSSKEADSFLVKFYAALRRHDGSSYTHKSMHGIKFGLQRHFQEIHGWDITRDKDFRESIKVFRAILLRLKQAGLAVVRSKTFISDSDFLKIKTSGALNINTPLGLQNKVFVDITMFLCSRGRQNLRDMNKNDFILQTDDAGFRYIIHKDQLQRINMEDAGTSVGGRLYEEPGNSLCPLQAFLKYTSKLHPVCLSFWQTPKKVAPDDDEPWYAGVPIGVNTLSGKMRQISIAAGCSRLYSNQCLRTTGIKWLQNRSSGSSVSNFNQSTRPMEASSTDVQVKQEVMVINETMRPTGTGYLGESVSNISTGPNSKGDEYIGHAVILENQVQPEGFQDNSDDVLLEDDEDNQLYESGVDEMLEDSDQGIPVGTPNQLYTTNENITKGTAIATDTHCPPMTDCGNALSDDEETAEEREERGIKMPFKRLTERHFVAVNKGRTPLGQPSKPQCIVCSNPAVKRHRTEFICEQCILPMCPAPCFKRYHTMADYKTTCSDAYHTS
ncbi:uncharacterized protein LOC117123679 [Anneissia japonica]|uniref:uncharacterized protein LOC117123679 n=1 Tax=Anneissia japonica TaxID=1529436 RepID=UPI0014259816|nr:uncharacterized protein LOC117123679 [Anneissia japonica]